MLQMVVAQCIRFGKPFIGVELGSSALAYALAVGDSLYAPLNGDGGQGSDGASASERKHALQASDRVAEQMRRALGPRDPWLPVFLCDRTGDISSHIERAPSGRPASAAPRMSGAAAAAAAARARVTAGAWEPLTSVGLRRWDRYPADRSQEAGAQSRSAADRARRLDIAGVSDPMETAVEVTPVGRALLSSSSSVFSSLSSFRAVSRCPWRVDVERLLPRAPELAVLACSLEKRGALVWRVGSCLAV